MIENIEISTIDLRYEGYRMQNKGREKALLCSIMENGIREALEGVDTEQGRILLDGFKRYRCAKKINLGIVPYRSIGNDEAEGIIRLMRTSNNKSLSILEQARLIEDLRSVHNMGVMEIAQDLDRSKSWVSMRIGLIREISECVMEKMFKGAFPVYSYMYTLRQFIRMNCVKDDIDEFVESVAGRNLSIRAIERLAHGYFKGPPGFREQIKKGNIAWGLKVLEDAGDPECCNEHERGMLRDMEILQKYMQRFSYRCSDKRFKSSAFYAQANLLAAGILSKINIFKTKMEAFYDRTGNA
jgi:hypothetical protein